MTTRTLPTLWLSDLDIDAEFAVCTGDQKSAQSMSPTVTDCDQAETDWKLDRTCHTSNVVSEMSFSAVSLLSSDMNSQLEALAG